MADTVIEASGSVSGARQAVDLVKKSGRISFLGLYPHDVPLDLKKIVLNNVQAAGGRGEGEQVIERMIPFFKDGRLNAKAMITHKFGLEDINTAFDTFINRSDGAVKVIINP